MMAHATHLQNNSGQERQRAVVEDRATDTQIGGDHYKTCAIQPVEYIEANGLPFLEGCVVKRVTRHAKPTGKGLQDIDKAIHELQLIRQLRYGGGDE